MILIVELYCSEQLIKRIADAMVSGGYRDAGYEYVIVDDCWSEMKRDSSGHLHPDPIRFPSGMKNLGDYVFKKKTILQTVV